MYSTRFSDQIRLAFFITASSKIITSDGDDRECFRVDASEYCIVIFCTQLDVRFRKYFITLKMASYFFRIFFLLFFKVDLISFCTFTYRYDR